MAKIILVCGSTGAGKTTHSIKLAKDIDGVRFSIDPWMHKLYSADMEQLDYTWITERVGRCEEVIWDTASGIVAVNGNVVLDLGFGSRAQREKFMAKAKALGVDAEVHFLDISKDVRKSRVKQRNANKDPDLYSFEVTTMMFDFMEERFQPPDEKELINGMRVTG